METQTYEREYHKFIEEIGSGGSVSAEDVGVLISKLAQHYSDAVKRTSIAEMSYNKKLVEFEQGADESGKSISSIKAANLSKATEEYELYLAGKGDVVSVEQMINALKSLQKALLNEYSHFGNQ